jgi:hypothetical protein
VHTYSGRMASARPLRDLFSDLAASGTGGDAEGVLDAHGHADLPEGLVAEAVVNYADTAPVEVAEHLATFVMAHSAVYPEAASGPADPTAWLDAVATAPVVDALDGGAFDGDGLDGDAFHSRGADDLTDAGDLDSADLDVADLDPADLDFGHGGHPAASHVDTAPTGYVDAAQTGSAAVLPGVGSVDAGDSEPAAQADAAPVGFDGIAITDGTVEETDDGQDDGDDDPALDG